MKPTQKIFLALVFAFILFRLQPVWAQTLDDFKDAVAKGEARDEGKAGCDSIPYSNLQEDCKSRQQDADDACSGGPRSCQGLSTKALKEYVDDETTWLNILKPLKDKFESQKTDADDSIRDQIDRDMAELQSQIDTASNKIDAYKRRIEDNRAKISERIDRGEKCRDNRRKVQEVYDNAKSKAGDESDPDIKPLADKLVTMWDAGKTTHDVVIGKVSEVTDKCRRYYDGSE